MPYYPPYPYRPAYGNGHYPSNGYNRPPNYNSGFQNTGNIYINTGDKGSGNNYWDRYRQQGAPGKQRWRHLQPRTDRAKPNHGGSTESRRAAGSVEASAAANAGQREAPLANGDRRQLEGAVGYAGKANKSGSARCSGGSHRPGDSRLFAPGIRQSRHVSPGNPSRRCRAATPGPGTTRVSRQSIALRPARATLRRQSRVRGRATTRSQGQRQARVRHGGDRGYDTNPQREHANRSSPKTSGGRAGGSRQRRCPARTGAARTAPPVSAASRACRRVPAARAATAARTAH